MWKLLLTAAIVASLGEAQRSSYAPRPGSNSRLLPRFRKNETDAGLGTRGGQDDADSPRPASTLSPEFQGTLEDREFVHRVSQWPAERQPFWFKNRHAISSMRNRDIDGGTGNRPSPLGDQKPRPQFQSPFQGFKNVGTRTAVEPLSNEPLLNEDLSYERDPLVLYLRRMRKS